MSKKKTPEHKAKMEARAARRKERSDRSMQKRADDVAIRELTSRIVNKVRLEAKGTASKRVHVTGTPSKSVTPPVQDEEA